MSDFDKGYIHEALDRCHVICANIDDHLLTHPAVKRYAEIEALILEGQSKIAEAYQKFGALSIEDEPLNSGDSVKLPFICVGCKHYSSKCVKFLCPGLRA